MKRVFAPIVVGVLTVISSACTHPAVNHAPLNRTADHATMDHAAMSHVEPTVEPKTIHQPTAEQQSVGIRQAFSDADIDFMAGIIPHHAQAVIMAGWAPSHGARHDVAVLCERIVVGQDGRNPFDAAMVARSRPNGSRCEIHADAHENERRRTRHVNAGNADGRRNGRTGQSPRFPSSSRLFPSQGMIKHHQGAI